MEIIQHADHRNLKPESRYIEAMHRAIDRTMQIVREKRMAEEAKAIQETSNE